METPVINDQLGEDPLLLKIQQLNKSFAAPVLKNLDFDLRPGEVHALMGSNGAGKSTLCNIIAGIHQPDSGAMQFKGAAYLPKNIRSAEQRGVRMVMQELNLFPTLSIAENISFRALSSNAGGLINHKRLDNKAKAALASFHLDHLNPRTLTSRLGVGQQQLIEIASVITDRVELLILDEPTAALTDPEIDELFFQVKRLRDQGTGIIYISHRMDEISKIADRISVLRDGELVATAKVDEINKDEIITLMAGQVVETASKKPARQTSPVPLLRVDHLGSQGSFQKICFEVNKGEVLGIGGLIGSGRTELLRAIFGADQADTGGVRLAADNFDELHKMRSPKQAIALGIGMVVEDRKTQGLLMPCSISQNISLGSLTELSKKLGILDRDQERQSAAQLAALLEVKFDQLNQAVSQLSGGNQQKILIARWLLKQLPILLFDEPTRGVDARAKQLIQNLIREQASDGKAIIVVSSETQELIEISDRILIMSNGRLAGEFDAEAVTEEQLLEASFKYYSRATTDESGEPAARNYPS